METGLDLSPFNVCTLEKQLYNLKIDMIPSQLLHTPSKEQSIIFEELTKGVTKWEIIERVKKDPFRKS